MSLPSILPYPAAMALSRAAALLDVTAATGPLPAPVYQAAWIAAKAARGQVVRADMLAPAHLAGPARPATPATPAPPAACSATVAQIDAIRTRVAARLRHRLAAPTAGAGQ